MKIGIIVAMDKELAQLRNIIISEHEVSYMGTPMYAGSAGTHEIVLQKCGIGKVNASVGALKMIISEHPDIIVSSGCAGGASTRLEVTDVVVGSEYRFHDVYCGSEVEYGQMLGQPACYEADSRLLSTALSLDCPTAIHSGLMVSGDWFVDSRDKMSEILSHHPTAMAVDMESAAIAQVCHNHNVPFISFRIISDVPLSDHKAAQYYDFWSRMADGSFEVTRTFIESL